MNIKKWLEETYSLQEDKTVLEYAFSGNDLKTTLDTVGINLLDSDEFKNVKKINILPIPMFLVNPITKEPIWLDENYLGGKTERIEVINIKYNDNIVFNDEIDLFSIKLSLPIYDDISNLDCGVWQTPLCYNPNDFTPYNIIKIKYSIEGIKDAKAWTISDFKDIGKFTTEDARAKIKKTILKQVEDLIDSGNINIPAKRDLIIRCSPRSIKKD